MGAEVTMFGPSRPPRPWVVSGLIVQAAGVGAAAVVLWRNIRNEGLGGHITAEMVRFAWRSELHTRAGLIVLAAGAVLYAAGSVVMARPYISRPAMLFIAIPVAAVAGLLVLGVLALAVAAVVAALTDSSSWGFPIGRERGKDRRQGSGSGGQGVTVADDHEAHAAGRTCQRCMRLIEPGQPARLRGECDWVHDVCRA